MAIWCRPRNACIASPIVAVAPAQERDDGGLLAGRRRADATRQRCILPHVTGRAGAEKQPNLRSIVSRHGNEEALVTGASEGIGRTLALRLAKEGYRVTGVARNEARLAELVSAMEPAMDPEGHRALVADLTDPAALDTVCEEVRTGDYDLVVNNAGFGVYSHFAKVPVETYQQIIDLNCRAVLAICHAYLSVAQRGDALVNVSSGTAVYPLPYGAVYCATKAFLINLSEALWFEYRRRGIYVTALVPGLTHSEFHNRAQGTDDNAPPKFFWESPQKVADVVVRALRSRSRPSVSSNMVNRIQMFSTRVMSRKGVVKMMGGVWEDKWRD